MRVFTRIVELGGFAKAADSLQLPRASVTILIKQLEAHLGVQLLQRTTRQVSPTLDGAAYYQRCVQLLTDLEETEAVFSTQRQNPRGTLSIDMPAGIGRYLVIPALPTFTARYPHIALEIGLNDRPVDLIREGVDCVLRGGLALDESLVARPLAMMDQITLASPAYLARMGVPETLDDLARHQMVEYVSSASGKRFGLEFEVGGELRAVNLPKVVAVNGADGYFCACGGRVRVDPGPVLSRRATLGPGRAGGSTAAGGRAENGADRAVPAASPVITAGAGVCGLAG